MKGFLPRGEVREPELGESVDGRLLVSCVSLARNASIPSRLGVHSNRPFQQICRPLPLSEHSCRYEAELHFL